jgi:MoxR-like ATPase
MARQGKLDPVIGRDDEIKRVMQILSRRTKNNPVIVGEAGVGKTAIAEGLAQTIRWYLDHEEWWRRIKSGAYLDFYQKHYGDRLT